MLRIIGSCAENHRVLRQLFPEWREFQDAVSVAGFAQDVSNQIAEGLLEAISDPTALEIIDEEVQTAVRDEIEQPSKAMEANGLPEGARSYAVMALVERVWKLMQQAPAFVRMLDAWAILSKRAHVLWDMLNDIW
jgi:hypothetical protein